MGATFVMSYPAADWSGASRKPGRPAGPSRPRAALAEWIALADAIHYPGGRILVVDPPPPSAGGGERPHGLCYAADWGALVRRDDQPRFLLPRPPAHRAGEAPLVRDFFAAAGVPVQELELSTSGRGDLIQVGPGRFLFVTGAHTDPGAAALIARELGATVRYVEASIAEPFAFGDEVATVLPNKAGDVVMLVHEAGLRGRGLPDLRTTFQKVEVLPVDDEDAEAGACTALAVNGTVIHPPGLSTALRSTLVRRGLVLVELDFPELGAAGGGGAHALVNELIGFVIGPGAPDYPHARERIVALLETYPETIG
jgi:N-dimethylarginine dimethylaminohydrolase